MIINPSRFIEFIRRTRSSSALLTPLERSSIIVMHNLGLGPDLIAQMIERDVRAVHRWITHFNEYSNLDDEPRSGPLNQKIGAWGAFSARGIAPIHLYTDTMNMQRLRTVFRTNLRPAALAQFPNQQWFLLHDNAPYHDGHLISEYIFDQGFELIHIPTYSPDLNPIENLWAILKREVEAMNPVNEEQLRQFVNEKWLTITPTMCRHLATSMPDRIKCVLACEGHKTGY
jgi:transposase